MSFTVYQEAVTIKCSVVGEETRDLVTGSPGQRGRIGSVAAREYDRLVLGIVEVIVDPVDGNRVRASGSELEGIVAVRARNRDSIAFRGNEVHKGEVYVV